MATTKNITMKQFNGTDYDTLYPKTKVEQIENLTPSSIGAVSKTGDTMTGNLNIASNNGTTSLIQYSGNTTIRNTKDSQNYTDIEITRDDLLVFNTMISGHYNRYNILHTGNLSNLGVARSQSGSYVGTGTYGPSNPCSITFSFKPKIVIFPSDTVYDARGKSMIAVDSLTTSYQDVDGTLGYKVYAKFDTTTNTLYWYASTRANEAHQLNSAGVTYYWVAIG